MSHASLVRSLFDGPVDVAGDIHGEIDAMKDLMGHLGYREDGKPPEGRRLVFLGDLTDRGPENLAVVNLVKELVEGGKAACVLGNHDLNILLNRQREGNDWFFALDADARSRVQAFFQSLPLALERPGLRVVHACWQDDMIELARHSSDVVALYKQHARLIEEANAAGPTLDDVGKRLKAQNLNPVKLLTSGPERRASTPSLKGGRLRYEERADWWLDYAGLEVVVFGHYAIPADQPHVFGRAICVDYGGGYRALERSLPGFDGQYKTRLAAVRFPEQQIIFDDGTSLSVDAEAGCRSRGSA